MPEQINGTPALIQANLPGPLSIVSSTNASPIVVETSASHHLRSGDYIQITGAAVAGVNGDWIAGAAPTSAKIQLLNLPAGTNSSAPGSAGGAGGTLQNLGFGIDGSYSIPVDLTDPRDAGSVNVALENLGARTSYSLYLARFVPFRTFAFTHDDEHPNTNIENFTLNTYTAGSTVKLDVTGLLIGDAVLMHVYLNARYHTTEAPENFADLRLSVTQGFGGGAPATSPIAGAHWQTKQGSDDAETDLITPISWTAQVVATRAGTMRIFIQGQTTLTGDLHVWGTASILALVYRPAP